jgi:plasmid maintenance system antidote protein VapI
VTGAELAQYIEIDLGTTRRKFAKLLDVTYRTVCRWINEEVPIPRTVEIIVQADCIRVDNR